MSLIPHYIYLFYIPRLFKKMVNQNRPANQSEMKEYHTPRKDYARPSELANRRSKDSSSKKLQNVQI